MSLTRPFRLLPPHVHVAEIADVCRDAALAFLNGANAGWGRGELALWLSGPYAEVTSHVNGAQLDGDGGAPYSILDMQDARAELLATLRTLEVADHGVTFAFTAIGKMHVVRCSDDNGRRGWAPCSRPRMSLADRVSSLVAVDYLTHPSEYETALTVCAGCGAVVFYAPARARGLCALHAGSGVHFNERAPREAAPSLRRTAV